MQMQPAHGFHKIGYWFLGALTIGQQATNARVFTNDIAISKDNRDIGDHCHWGRIAAISCKLKCFLCIIHVWDHHA